MKKHILLVLSFFASLSQLCAMHLPRRPVIRMQRMPAMYSQPMRPVVLKVYCSQSKADLPSFFRYLPLDEQSALAVVKRASTLLEIQQFNDALHDEEQLIANKRIGVCRELRELEKQSATIRAARSILHLKVTQIAQQE